MQFKDQINDLRRVHTLLDVAGQGYLVDTYLIRWLVLQLVLESKLCRLILNAKVDRLHNSSGR